MRYGGRAALILLAGLLPACVEPYNDTGTAAAARAAAGAAAPPAVATRPMVTVASDAEARVAGFCAERTATAKLASGEAAGRLAERANRIVQAYWQAPQPDPRTVGEAIELSCRARAQLPADERNGAWAWNELNLGTALLIVGSAREDRALLELALAASTSATGAFDRGSEGWSWARHGTGRSAAELFRRDGSPAHKTMAMQAFREVAATTTPAARYAGQELAALAP